MAAELMLPEMGLEPMGGGSAREIQFREALREAMSEEMRKDDRIFLMGEEVAQYNGAYKVSQGMLDEFGPKRIIDAPISENGFAGLAVGAAMYGLNVIAGLEAISVPTAVVVGSEDRLTPPLHADFLAKALDRNGVLLTYDTYPEAGHMVPIERSLEFNQLLDDVLAVL